MAVDAQPEDVMGKEGGGRESYPCPRVGRSPEEESIKNRRRGEGGGLASMPPPTKKLIRQSILGMLEEKGQRTLYARHTSPTDYYGPYALNG